MTVAADVLAPRWRRLDAKLVEVRAATQSSDADSLPLAVADALDAVYDLWELWRSDAGLAVKDQDTAVSGDPDGETTAALVFARGGKTHDQQNFGLLLGYGRGRFGEGPYGASGWHWQPYADQTPRFSARNAWYASHLKYKQVLPTLEAASRWLRARPELDVPHH